MAAKIIKSLAYFLLVGGIGIIFFGYIGTFMTQGWSGLQELLSPINLVNWLTVALTLAPGFLLLLLSQKLERAQS